MWKLFICCNFSLNSFVRELILCLKSTLHENPPFLHHDLTSLELFMFSQLSVLSMLFFGWKLWLSKLLRILNMWLPDVWPPFGHDSQYSLSHLLIAYLYFPQWHLWHSIKVPVSVFLYGSSYFAGFMKVLSSFMTLWKRSTWWDSFL